MGFLSEKCVNKILTEEILQRSKPFKCGKADLDDFFRKDALLYAHQRIGKTYCFLLEDDPTEIVCLYTLANSSIRADLIPNSRGKKLEKNVPYPKRMKRYPTVLIGRLGVSEKFQGKGIGDELMDIIKTQVTDEEYLTCARYLAVDSYNEERPRKYYSRNNFLDLFSSDEQEAATSGESLPLETRFMYFDLMGL